MYEEDQLQLQMECTIFFQENPNTFESCDGLAIRMGRKPEHLEATLQRLVSLSILEKLGNGPRSIYRYQQPAVLETGAAWKSS